MARAGRVSNEESNSTTVNKGAGTEVSEQVGDEEREVAEWADSAVARLLPREDLRSCVICQRQDIKPEEFRAHVVRHKATYGGTPKGYYACWSGGEFWFPLKFATGPCKWLCSVCGSTKYYFGNDNTHGGPSTRLIDRRYGTTYCSKEKDEVIFLHEGAPWLGEKQTQVETLAPTRSGTEKSPTKRASRISTRKPSKNTA